ncbi:hypothetical protein [Skermanella pratensis]|uniref:hypothetical protein n=1 Tax=Skermanella pratensis TaxID=2233999 RepID=UPI001301335B|nr:hypothetical protein [Skermanella pratensis]
MSVRVAGGIIVLEGDCQVDEAEPLLEFLLANPGAGVDWSGCTHLHTALLQVLVAIRPKMLGSPDSEFLQKWILQTLN